MKHAIRLAAFAAATLCTSVVISQVEKKLQQTERFPQFENEDVKVWKTIVMPHQPLAMHHHDHPRVIIALTGGTMNIVDPSGAIEPCPIIQFAHLSVDCCVGPIFAVRSEPRECERDRRCNLWHGQECARRQDAAHVRATGCSGPGRASASPGCDPYLMVVALAGFFHQQIL